MNNDAPIARSHCDSNGTCNPHKGMPDSGGWCHDAAATLWSWLTKRLAPMVRAAVRCAQSAMEIVAAAASAAVLRFSCATAWEEILSWGCKVARNLVMRFYRARSRRRETSIENAREVDLVSRSDAAGNMEVADCLECLLPQLTPSARETLTLISAGVCSPKEIAAVRGVSARAVTKSLHGLRIAAAGIGNYS